MIWDRGHWEPEGDPHKDYKKGRLDFVLDGEKLYLLPVQGSDTQWYKNVLKNPSIRIDARGAGAKFNATALTDAKAVKSVVERFREKYGVKDVKKYYSKFDVAVCVELT